MMAAEKLAHMLDSLPPLRGRAQADAVLGPTTWFRVGGPAEVLVRPADAADLAGFLRALPHEMPVTVIGAASNLIVRDGGVPGVVVRLARGFNAIETDANGIIAGAAALDVTVAEHAAAAGLAGLEFLSGIPGTIGGAVAMNAGAYGGDIAGVLDWAEVVTRTGEIVRLSAATLAFAYRHAQLPPGGIVVRARLRARPGDPGEPRSRPARPCPHRRLHLPQPARHEGLGTHRPGRRAGACPRRRAGQRKALQFPA